MSIIPSLNRALLAIAAGGLVRAAETAVDFAGDIRPLLVSKCVSCHGGVKRAANLSFLSRDDALAPVDDNGADYLTGHIERLMDQGRIDRFDPAPLAEILARVTHSMLLTPTTTLQLGDDDTIRAGARDTFRWLLRLPPRTTT